jgi:hypothetical protein
MGRVVTLLVLTVVIGGVRLSSARERADEELPITIQIHDYCHVPTESLSRAPGECLRLSGLLDERFANP